MKSMKLNRQDSVSVYKELFDLFEDQNPDFLKGLTEDELIGLDHVLDFENYVFMVVNYETVVVILDGMVSSIYTLDKFGELTKELIKDL